jgi:hypothetical protein
VVNLHGLPLTGYYCTDYYYDDWALVVTLGIGHRLLVSYLTILGSQLWWGDQILVGHFFLFFSRFLSRHKNKDYAFG